MGDPATYSGIRLSPDGKKLAATIVDKETGNTDIWISELERGGRTRLTFGALNEDEPVWSPDGARIAFRGVRKVFGTLMVKNTDGSGSEELLFESETDTRPTDWSHDGRFILLTRNDPNGKNKGDIWVFPTFGDRKPFPLLATAFDENGASFSPDGRWVLYFSDESGKYEAYVTPFPGGGGKWQVSIGGAGGGGFRRGGREILYGGGTGEIFSAEVNGGGSSFTASRPAFLFKSPPLDGADITEDGQRFLLAPSAAADQGAPIALVLDWPAALRK